MLNYGLFLNLIMGFIIGFLLRSYLKTKRAYDSVMQERNDVQSMYNLSAERCIELENLLNYYKHQRFDLDTPQDIAYQKFFDALKFEEPQSRYEAILQNILGEEAFENPSLCHCAINYDAMNAVREVVVSIRLLPYEGGTK